jgi:hypothetical protein
MSVLDWVLAVGAFFAVFALVMTIINLQLYNSPTGQELNHAKADLGSELVSVCIPARNEEKNIEACVQGVLAQSHANVQVLIYNDQSTDKTGEIVNRLIAQDARVKVVPTKPLPDGWNGKQFGCDNMGRTGDGSWLLFTDADVRFAPDALASALSMAAKLNADLVSTFPKQITGTLSEKLTVPMIFFILLSYLPFPRMRTSKDPSASAACGQFILVRKAAYLKAGGHAAFRASMHDGVKMPREVRKAGFRTDLFDGTDVCSVRMYDGFGQVWRGFSKNAFEGLGSIGLLGFITVVHALAHVLPWVVIVWEGLIAARVIDGLHDRSSVAFALTAIAANLVQRSMLSLRFKQGWLTVLLHPLCVVIMTTIQWNSWLWHVRGKRAWKGRAA